MITDFIGSEQADIRSHTLVTSQFINVLWSSSKGDIKSQRATGMIIGKLRGTGRRTGRLGLLLSFTGTVNKSPGTSMRGCGGIFFHRSPSLPLIANGRLTLTALLRGGGLGRSRQCDVRCGCHSEQGHQSRAAIAPS